MIRTDQRSWPMFAGEHGHWSNTGCPSSDASQAIQATLRPTNILAKRPKQDAAIQERVRQAYWAALDEALCVHLRYPGRLRKRVALVQPARTLGRGGAAASEGD